MAELKSVHNVNPESYLFLGVRMNILLSGEQTGNAFSMIEGIMPPGGDGGLHLHELEDESMYLLSGELEVTLGDGEFILRPGETYFAPRNMPHRLRNLGSEEARTILINTPGTFDPFIKQAGIPLTGPEIPLLPPPTPEQIQGLLVLAAAFGIRILVPPGM